jgi:hypothetical protein
VAKDLGFTHVPVHVIDMHDKDVRGFNVMFNRVTNDFGALDTGSGALNTLTLSELIKEAEHLPDRLTPDEWPATGATVEGILGTASGLADRYDKKAVVAAENFVRRGIQIPLVLSDDGELVNGLHRLFAARENGIEEWPVVRLPDELGRFAVQFLNYLSMDFHVDEDFARLLRHSAYRRAQNNRGSVPKAYRFWGNGCRTLPDKDSYSRDYWQHFRDIHGLTLLDFGSGLSKVAPFLIKKGFDCVDFEPYRIDPDAEPGKPSPAYSKRKAKEFLEAVSDPGRAFSSIFLASVLNSVPFPQDRMAVLLICHALSEASTALYGTCRDISDFHYEYGGIRQANYFVFDSEPGVRLGDAISNPKLQKFFTQEEADTLLKQLWNKRAFWPGGNVFYFKAEHPKRVSPKALGQALELEFDLPYADGTTMGLVDEAKAAFSARLGVHIT